MVALAKAVRQDVGSLLEKGHRKMDEKKVREAIKRIRKMRDASDRGRKGCKEWRN